MTTGVKTYRCIQICTGNVQPVKIGVSSLGYFDLNLILFSKYIHT